MKQAATTEAMVQRSHRMGTRPTVQTTHATQANSAAMKYRVAPLVTESIAHAVVARLPETLGDSRPAAAMAAEKRTKGRGAALPRHSASPPTTAATAPMS